MALTLCAPDRSSDYKFDDYFTATFKGSVFTSSDKTKSITLPPGSYKLLIRALKLTGNPALQKDYECAFSILATMVDQVLTFAPRSLALSHRHSQGLKRCQALAWGTDTIVIAGALNFSVVEAAKSRDEESACSSPFASPLVPRFGLRQLKAIWHCATISTKGYQSSYHPTTERGSGSSSWQRPLLLPVDLLLRHRHLPRKLVCRHEVVRPQRRKLRLRKER